MFLLRTHRFRVGSYSGAGDSSFTEAKEEVSDTSAWHAQLLVGSSELFRDLWMRLVDARRDLILSWINID